MIENLIKELQKLQRIHKLLEKIYLEIGPYSTLLNPETMRELRDIFQFDDSE